MDSLINFLNAVLEFFLDIVVWVVKLFSRVFEWLLDAIKTWVDSLLSPLVDLIPDLSSYWDNLSAIAPYYDFVNSWVALDVGLSLLSAYFFYIVVMITVKLIIKLFIPTVG